MSTQTKEIVFTAAEVAAFAGIDLVKVRSFEPDGFAHGKHWRMGPRSQTLYTLEGARLLSQALAMGGLEEGGAALLEGVNKVEAAALIPVVTVPVQHAWQVRKDCQ